MEENKNIKHYTAADIQNYVSGKLSVAEMHAIEKAALDDPFLADAIEGMENSAKQQGSSLLNADIIDLQKRLSGRINVQRNAKVVFINRISWRIAVSLLILTATGILTYNYFAKSHFANKNVSQVKNENIVADTISSRPDSTGILSKRQTATNANPDVALNERRIEKKEEQKIHKTSISSHVLPEERKTDTFNVSKSSAHTFSISAMSNNNKFQSDSPNNDHALATIAPLSKNLTDFDKAHNANEFVGKVVDINSQPISGAFVNIYHQKNATVTDNKGMFKIFAPKADSTVKITVSSVGFVPAKAILVNDNDIENNTINLRSNTSSLNEVVVTGIRRKRKSEEKNIASVETLKNAEPVAGWKKYKEYLDNNKRLSGDSIGLRIIEVVSFTVKKNGKLGNFNIEQSYNDDFDDEAIRLIKTGPAWKLLTNKKARATLTIEF
ncbi:MAG TPA: carboxypeptidase-like regulatory domain-containing protein [Puia sp.]|nr:carboxypeptidase-like regulatory domain-containing protein [Puia sp.]